jgi:hypothetical protein
MTKTRRKIDGALKAKIALEAVREQATAMWTHVSGANLCTLPNPCRTLQAALGLTGPGGEVRSLDSADYAVARSEGEPCVNSRAVCGQVCF